MEAGELAPEPSRVTGGVEPRRLPCGVVLPRKSWCELAERSGEESRPGEELEKRELVLRGLVELVEER